MMVLAGMTACTNEDNIVQNQQPATPQAPVYQVSIPATIGDGAETRAVELGTGDKAGWLVSTFKTTDDIAVYWVTTQATDDQNNPVCLHADADGKTANLIGTLTFYEQQADPDPEKVDPIFIPQELPVGQYLRFVYNSKWGITFYTNQTGTFAGLDNYDFAIADVRITAISGDESGYNLTTTDAHFVNTQSMYKFTFTGLPTGVGVKSVRISSAGNHLVNRYIPYSEYNDHTPITITLDDAAREANGAGVVYAALRFDALGEGETDNIAFTVTGTDDNTYIATKDSPEGGFKNGKYYTSTIELTPTVGGSGQTVNLSTVSTNVVVLDGTTLTGTLGSNVKISIAPGATVTLSGVAINGVDQWGLNWAGLTCLGDATIVLADGSENTVRGFYSDYPGIQAGPAGTTLTISGGMSGTGTLMASSNDGGQAAGIGGGELNCGNITIMGGVITASGNYGAGIGSGYDHACGDITITGGTVTASSGHNGAGIGCGYQGTCGAITISGGTIEATGGERATGIGCGQERGTCGAITITNGEGFNSVTATGGYYSHKPIGLSRTSDDIICGVITFGNKVIYDGGANKNYVVWGVGGLNFSEENGGKTWILSAN